TPDANLCVIGDPDQAIYGFRGSQVGFSPRSPRAFPAAATVRLTRNYRSSPAIVAGALQAIAPSTLVPGRELAAMAEEASPTRITVHHAARPPARAAPPPPPPPPPGPPPPRRGRVRRPDDRPAAGRRLVPVAGQRPGRQRGRARGVVRGPRRAVPPRRPVGAAGRGPGPGRHAVPEALARPPARPPGGAGPGPRPPRPRAGRRPPPGRPPRRRGLGRARGRPHG